MQNPLATPVRRLSAEGAGSLEDLCELTTHLRLKTRKSFREDMEACLLDVDESPLRSLLAKGAIALAKSNWALAKPYFKALAELPESADFINSWYRLARALARLDVDTGIAFLEQSPTALALFTEEAIFEWGEIALAALSTEGKRRSMWRAARAYLIASAANSCGFSLDRWRFFLDHARPIADRSPAAAESFIQLGNRACLLLTDEEAGRWVEEGLAECPDEESLLNFFSGASQKAMEKRDSIVSGVTLKKKAETLSLICEAFNGAPVRIRPNTVLAGHPGFSGGAATDGRTVFLPEVAPEFGLYKLMALHQVALLSQQDEAADGNGSASDPVLRHLDADNRILVRLPGLQKEMDFQAEKLSSGGSTARFAGRPAPPMPWWGDILPDLVNATTSAIETLRDKASDHYGDIPPEVVEALLSAMMAEGERNEDALWKLFSEMLDNLQYASPDPEELQENVKTFFYKEWDEGLSDYKIDWCLVRQRFAKDDPNPFVASVRDRMPGIISLIRRQFTRLKPEQFKKYRAQAYGDALDIDALIEAVIDMRSGSFLSDNVYIRRDKRIRDVAVLFLVDQSGSTEEIVEGRRVIDIQKEAMALMAEALDALDDPFAIYGFSSEGRFRVDLFSVKDFSEPYSEAVQYRLGSLEPLGLTRMGAVVRHAVSRLEKVPAVIKLLVILTDGRPYDLEYGNLDYAVADTHKAVSEARRRNIHPFIITSDKEGARYLKRIAPNTQSVILPKVEMLPKVLPALYKRLTM